VRDLPVYGRPSATLELAGEARLTSMTIATRRFAGDGSGATVAKVEPRHPGDAARDVAERMARALHGAEEPRIGAQSFRFGYVSLSRRRPQAVLAPVYLPRSGAPRRGAGALRTHRHGLRAARSASCVSRVGLRQQLSRARPDITGSR
jgi:hypothetical protein